MFGVGIARISKNNTATKIKTDKTDKTAKAARRKQPPCPPGAVPFARAPKLTLHPLFIAVGVYYCFTGELFLFLMSCIVALQHECAHAFAAARLGYRLDRIILMPFGAVIDGDVHSLSLKDEISISIAGPVCNVATAAFFAALWWFFPDVYAFTDTACFVSLSIALVNVLPAYPLDGGRVLRCVLTRHFLRGSPRQDVALRKAANVCRVVTLTFALLLTALFAVLFFRGTTQLSLLTMSIFLAFSAFGNKNGEAIYAKIDVARPQSMQAGVEIKRVAILQACPIKDTLKFISKDNYLILDVYDEQETLLFSLPQNELSKWFLRAPSPYTTLRELRDK